MGLYLIGHDHPSWPPGLTYRQLDLWTRRGYLRAHNPNAGSGHVRQWPRREADVAAVMLLLVNAGFTPRVAETVARAAVAVGPNEPSTVELAPGVIVVLGPVDVRPSLVEELTSA